MSFLSVFCVTPASGSILVPAGTEIELRLKTKISSDHSKINDPVEAVVIAPVIIDSQPVIAHGTLVHGSIKAFESTQGKEDTRAKMRIDFVELEDTKRGKIKIEAQLTKVVNDLLFTGHVKLLELVERPAVPKDGSNATGDKLSTDGKMAVLSFE